MKLDRVMGGVVYDIMNLWSYGEHYGQNCDFELSG